MGSRRKSRESALKILYQVDILHEKDIGGLLRENPEARADSDKEDDFTNTLVRGVCDNKTVIDGCLEATLENWDLDRLGFLERSILRMGVFEILFQAVTPDKVAIDEAVELAKKFCDPDSAKLVNGTLDRVMNDKADKRPK